jgi:hypothetical protein
MMFGLPWLRRWGKLLVVMLISDRVGNDGKHTVTVCLLMSAVLCGNSDVFTKVCTMRSLSRHWCQTIQTTDFEALY